MFNKTERFKYLLVILSYTMVKTKQPPTKTYEEFVCNILKIGNSLGIIIPNNHIKFSGLKEKDIMKIWYKKIIKSK